MGLGRRPGTLRSGGAEATGAALPPPALVSIVIPCYNQGRFLAGAVESVLGQTWARWEAIIVDDGSTDETPQVVASFGDPRIRSVRQENRGLAGARNAAVALARGEYLAFLDSDDQYERTFLETCVAALQAKPQAPAVYTRFRYMDEVGRVLPEVRGDLVPAGAFRERILEGGFFPPCAVVIRKDGEGAGLFDARFPGLEDWDLWLRLSEAGPFEAVPSPLARYRVYRGAMSTNAERMHTSRMAVVQRLAESPDGDPTSWPDAKRRAYGFAWRASAVGYLQQHDEQTAQRLLCEAVHVWPPLLARLDTFYELACGDQDRAVRGQAGTLDLAANGARLLEWLRTLYGSPPANLVPYRRMALGCAFQALAMLYDQAGDWGESRRLLLRALRADPALVASPVVLRRLAKVVAGKRAALLARATAAAVRARPWR